MLKKIVKYTGVTKAWANKYRNKRNASWINKYKLEYFEGILILKENDTSRLCDYKQILKHRALVRLLPG